MKNFFQDNRISSLFDIEYPIIQAGMIWISGGKLAAACSNAGILGLIGAGSMAPELLEKHIKKAQQLTNKPFGINLPLLYHRVEEQIEVALKSGVKIFFTSAGSPKKYTAFLKEKGCTVVHVTSSPELAVKCENARVDAIVAEGFEAGGHNGRDEITTMCLIPQVVDAVNIPVIAAGGIGDGRAIAASMVLGADGVQIGTRFIAVQESSAHQQYVDELINAGSGATFLAMKRHVPVRLVKNHFFESIQKMEKEGRPIEEIVAFMGKDRAKKGMLEGDVVDGKLEAGQVCAMIKDNPTSAELVQRLIQETKSALSF